MSLKGNRFEPGTLRCMLRDDVKDVHNEADTLFRVEMFERKVSKKIFATYMAQLYFLYEAMETELERNKDHPLVAPVYFPDELNRLEALEKDMESLYGVNWRSEIQCLPSMREYVRHIHEIAKDAPELIIPHAFVRYYGDISGGQILKPMIQKTWAILDDAMNFLNFNHIASIPRFKQLYDARINELDLTDEGKQSIIREAVAAFQHNINLFKDLVQVAQSDPEGYMKTDTVTPIRGCPVHRNGSNGHITFPSAPETEKAAVLPSIVAVTSLLAIGTGLVYKFMFRRS